MAAKVFSENSKRNNIEIAKINLNKIGINVTDDFEKSDWVVFNVEQAKELRLIIDAFIKDIEEEHAVNPKPAIAEFRMTGE